jgi:hypothetical protein
MAVQSSDIKYYYTVGLSGNSANSNGNASTGGNRSTSQLGSGINNLYDNVTGTNHAAGNTDTGQANDYRVIAMKLDSPLADASSSTLDNAVLKIASSSFLSGDKVQAYIAATVNHTITAGADENTPPTDGGAITFSDIPGGGLAMPTSIAPGDEVHIALKRTIAAASTAQQENITLQVIGDTI